MHEFDIIFRDLKPENMLLSAAGRMKVSDFGLAKVSAGKTFTLCGDSAYCAPEMCARTGHTQAVDWWAVGITTLELMKGVRLFKISPRLSWDARFWCSVIRNGIELPDIKPQLPVFAGMSGECETFVRDLTRLSPMDRIPMKEGGIDNIKKHQWFQEFQWAALLDKTCEPPYKPFVASDTDLSNFECAEVRLPPMVDYEEYDDGSMWDADFATSA
jgi:serine/threonine protein kinase